jgi:hypothetical protein
MSRKPPLGALDNHSWKWARVRELARALERYAEYGYDGCQHTRAMKAWARELYYMMKEYDDVRS